MNSTKSIIKEEMLDLIGLVETKHNEVSKWDMRKCWGHQGSYHMHVTAAQGSDGLLLSWHQEAFTLNNSLLSKGGYVWWANLLNLK